MNFVRSAAAGTPTGKFNSRIADLFISHGNIIIVFSPREKGKYFVRIRFLPRAGDK